jgi:O-antigen/teichoic acid export membrane protein
MLTYRNIFFFWLPLALSWLLMTFEGPWVQGVIGRKPDAELQLAAFGLVVSLSVTIEAPVIMLLATGSALTRNRHAYRVLWRFVMILNIILTIVHLLMAFTPLLDVYLGGLLGIPPDIIAAVRPGMAIMILWSALIGYRRFHQGVMIRQGHTRAVSYGTVIRIAVSGGIAMGFGTLTAMPGSQIGALALVVSVGAEAIYSYFASRRDVDTVLATPLKKDDVPLGYSDVLRFHLPLAFTSVLTLLVRPVIESGLAGTSDAKQALAAFPVIFAILLVLRAGGFAWQEVVISLGKGQAELDRLRRFMWVLGISTSILTLLFSFSPLIYIYMVNILSVPESLHALVVTGTQLSALLPLLAALQSDLRARLMLMNRTTPIYQSMIVSFITTAGVMVIGLRLQVPGIALSSLALTAGGLLELLYVWRAYVPAAARHQAQFALHSAAD